MGWYQPPDVSTMSFRQEETGNGGGLTGFLKNAWGEGQQMIQGLAGLGGAGLHDIIRLVQEGATLGHYDPANDVGYLTPKIAGKLLPAIAEDINQRYLQPIVHADYGEFANQMYEHPLSYGLDVAGAGAVAEGVAKRVGLAAAKSTPAAEAAMTKALSELAIGRDLSSFGSFEEVQRLLKELPAVSTGPRRSIPAAAREGLVTLEQSRPLTGLEQFAKSVLPPVTKRLRGEELVPFALHQNPVIRPLDKLIRRTFTEPVGRYGERISELSQKIDSGIYEGSPLQTQMVNDLLRMQGIAEEAKTLGIRLERPAVAKGSLWKAANDWYSGTSSMHLLRRQKEMQAFIDLIKPWMERFPNLKHTGYAFLNRLDSNIAGIWDVDERLKGTAVVHPDAGTLGANEIADAKKFVKAWDELQAFDDLPSLDAEQAFNRDAVVKRLEDLSSAYPHFDRDVANDIANGIEAPHATVEGPAGLPRRVYHGTGKVFDDFDESRQDPDALFGPGFYHTEDPSLASSYSRSGRTVGEQRTEVVKGDAAAIKRRDELRSQGYENVQMAEPTGPHPSREREHTITYREPAPSNVRGSYLNIRNPFRPDETLTPDVLRNIDKAVKKHIDGLPEGIKAELLEQWNDITNDFRVNERNGAPRSGEELYRELNDFMEEVSNKFSGELDLLPAWQSDVIDTGLEVMRRHGVPDEVIQEINIWWDQMAEMDAEYNRTNPQWTPNEILDQDAEQLFDKVEELVGNTDNVNTPAFLEEFEREVSKKVNEVKPQHAAFDTRDILEEAGFDGIQHLGGGRVGNKRHNVWISFHKDQTLAGMSLPISRRPAPKPAKWFERSVGQDIDHKRMLDLDVNNGRLGEALSKRERLVKMDVVKRDRINPQMVEQADTLMSDVRELLENGHIPAEDAPLLADFEDLVARTLQRREGVSETGLNENHFVDDVRLKTLQDGLNAIEVGVLDMETLLERPYRALRMKYGAHVDKKTGLLTDGPDWRDLRDAFNNQGEAPPAYYPFMSAQHKTLADFFRSTKKMGYETASADPHYKFMEGVLLKSGDFIRDPMEAYMRRAARGVRAEETLHTMLRMTQQFGRRIQTGDELGSHEVVIAPRYLFMQHKVQRLFEDKVDELLEMTGDRESSINEALKYAIEEIQDHIVNKELDATDIEMYAVPKVVADRLTDAQRFAGFGGKWAAYVDAPMKIWRNIVLLGRPAWVLNNLLGNGLFAKLQGASLVDMMHLLENRYAKLLNAKYGFNFSTKMLDAIQDIPGIGDVGSGFFSTIGAFEPKNPQFERFLKESNFGKVIDGAMKHAPRKMLSRYGDFVKMMNREVESAAREASYLTALERNAGISSMKRTLNAFMGSRRRIDELLSKGIALGTKELPGAGAKFALAEVDKFFGNYTRLTPFERHIVRRFIFPWWGFYRHQLKLMLTFPFDYPGRAKLLQQVSFATLDMMNAYGEVPEWLNGAVPLSPPGMPGSTNFLSTRGPNPFEGTFQPWTSQVNPLLKVLMERAQGRSSFTGQPFTDKDTFSAYGSDQQYRVIYDDNGFPIDAVPVGNVAPGILEHLLQQLPQYNMVKQGLAGGKTYDTETLMDVLRGEGPRTDSQTGEPLVPTDLLQQLQKMLGFSTVDYDLNAFQERMAQEKEQVINQALARMGT